MRECALLLLVKHAKRIRCIRRTSEILDGGGNREANAFENLP